MGSQKKRKKKRKKSNRTREIQIMATTHGVSLKRAREIDRMLLNEERKLGLKPWRV
jgi:hypothetical protein